MGGPARPGSHMTGRRSVVRRVERALLGFVFGIVAFVIERRVLKAIRKKGGEVPKPSLALVDQAVGELEH